MAAACRTRYRYPILLPGRLADLGGPSLRGALAQLGKVADMWLKPGAIRLQHRRTILPASWRRGPFRDANRLMASRNLKVPILAQPQVHGEGASRGLEVETNLSSVLAR